MQRALSRLSAFVKPTSSDSTAATRSTSRTMSPDTADRHDDAEILSSRKEWQRELESLPTLEETGGKIPSIFLAHGQPMLIMPPHLVEMSSRLSALADIQGPTGLLANFLRDLGPFVLERYKPKAVVVLSAHWETAGSGGTVTDYGAENPLLYDYFGFPPELYDVKFRSSGDSTLSRRIVELLRHGGIDDAKLTTEDEPRGDDGRGFKGSGLDHGVFVPFKLMFGDKCSIPIVQVSISSDLSPDHQRKLGKALEPLRSEGVLVIAGGLTIHTFQDFAAFSPKSAKAPYRSFESALVRAVSDPSYASRTAALDDLVEHSAFRLAHPREEHFVPVYVAAGASDEAEREEGKRAKVVCGLWGAKTVFFGV
ncbi:hypothetical protein JCM10212_005997 [Sporobolomyces blumeae]